MVFSYTDYEKKNVEETLSSIKELVSKKVNLLINNFFEKDENVWFNSLKLKNADDEYKKFCSKLIFNWLNESIW